MTRRIVALVPDLMDRSRLDGRGVDFVGDVEALVEAARDASLVVVDLGRPGVADAAAALARSGCHVVGFVPHVDDEVRRAAVRAGVEVLPRSRFFGALDDVLAVEGR